MNKKFIILLAFIGLIGITFALDSKQEQVSPPATDNKTVTIGSKIFTENILLAEMLSLILEEKIWISSDKKI